MPASSIIPALIGSVLGTAADSTQAPLPPQAPQQQWTTEGAVLRVIPPEAKRGEMLPPANGFVVINKTMLRLAPGAQIRSPQNMIVLSDAIVRPTIVRYTTDFSGDVFRIWILTPAEARPPEPR